MPLADETSDTSSLELPDIPDWVFKIGPPGGAALVALADIGVNGAEFLKSLYQNPTDTLRDDVISIVSDYLFTEVVLPIVGAIIHTWGVVYDSLLWVAFGTDRLPGVHPLNAGEGAGIGLLDVPLYVVAWLGQALDETAAQPILGAIGGVGTIIESVAALTGPAAPIVIPVMWLGVAGAVVWSAWWVLYTIDVPLVDQAPTLDALSAPARKLVGWIGR